MRFYIVDYKGDVLGDFGSYTAAKLHMRNYEKEFIAEMELEIIQEGDYSWADEDEDE